jgi:hypothetical protein
VGDLTGKPVMWCEQCCEWHEDATPYRADPTPVVPGCSGKRRHATAPAAIAAAKDEARNSGRSLHPYPCKHCGGWHLSKQRLGLGLWRAGQIEREAAARLPVAGG